MDAETPRTIGGEAARGLAPGEHGLLAVSPGIGGGHRWSRPAPHLKMRPTYTDAAYVRRSACVVHQCSEVLPSSDASRFVNFTTWKPFSWLVNHRCSSLPDLCQRIL